MGFGTCCGETSLTAFAVRSGRPVMTCSRRVRTPDRSPDGAGAGGGGGGVGGVPAGGGGGWFGAGGFSDGTGAGGGFVSDIFQPFSEEKYGEYRLEIFPVFPFLLGEREPWSLVRLV